MTHPDSMSAEATSPSGLLAPQDAAIRATGVRKAFAGREVLRGVNLQARRGEVLTLLGSSGSGKSTLLRCLNLLESPDEGRLFLGPEELVLQRDRRGGLVARDAAQLRRWRTRLGMVFQNFHLWAHLTALENVMEVPVHVQGVSRAEARDKAEALLARVGVAHRAGVLPAMLSGGEQQRVAIARALAVEPEVMLFDEPTSALDPEMVGEVLKVMQQLATEGRTMIIVTHEIGFAREVSHRTLFLHQGAVEEEGPTREVLGQPRSERLRQFLGTGLK